jgi:capsular polysaccharide biosynthesis protein
MERTQSLSDKLRHRKGVVTITILIALALTYGVLLTRPFEYQAEVQLLIVQEKSENQDLLSTLRATEQVGRNLVDVIGTSTFFEKVLASDFPITRKFSDQPEKRREEWRTAVHASVSQQSGILSVTVLDPDRDQATILGRAIADVMTRESQEFHGKSNIIVKVVDDVYAKRWPVKPNLLGSTLAALFFGTLAGIGLVALLPNRTERSNGSKPEGRKPAEPERPSVELPQITGRFDQFERTKQVDPPSGLAVGEDTEVA